MESLRCLPLVAGFIFLAETWLDRIIDAARAGALVVSNTTSTRSFPSDATKAVQSGFSPKAVSIVFATMRFVFIVHPKKIVKKLNSPCLCLMVGIPESELWPDQTKTKEAA
jgi:hypothetical protein